MSTGRGRLRAEEAALVAWMLRPLPGLLLLPVPLLLLTLLLLCHMVADDAAPYRANHRVMARNMSRHGAHGGTLDAALGLGAVRDPQHEQRGRKRGEPLSRSGRGHLRVPRCSLEHGATPAMGGRGTTRPA